MQIELKSEITIDAPAAKAWHILAHKFDEIGTWATAIPESSANDELPVPDGAEVGGRVCATSVRGFPDVHESFTHYDESKMQYGYSATSGLPAFMQKAENNWSVHEVGPNQCLVKTRAVVEFNTFPGLFLIPLFKLQINRVGAQTMEELKYFVEQGHPHPRKLKAQQKELPQAVV